MLGSTLSFLGLAIPFTQTAVVLAVAFVSSPLYVRQAIASFEAVDPALIDASRTLGASPARTFWRVALPLALGGLAAGAALSFARGLGEFGATIMFAGSLQGRHADAAARDLLAVRGRLHDGARDRRAARRRQRRPPRHPQAVPAVDVLRLDIAVPLRAFAVELALDVEPGRRRPGRAVGRGEDDRPARDRGLDAARARARSSSAMRRGSRASARVDLRGRTARSVGIVFQDYALFPHMSVRAQRRLRRRAGRRRAAPPFPHRPPRRREAGRALRRRAPARRARPRARARPPRPAARRAARRRSTRTRRTRCAPSSASTCASSRCRRCSSRTTSTTPPSLADRVGVIVEGGSSNWTRRSGSSRRRRRLRRRRSPARTSCAGPRRGRGDLTAVRLDERRDDLLVRERRGRGRRRRPPLGGDSSRSGSRPIPR